MQGVMDMSETVVGRAAEYIAESVGQASRVTSVVADAVQEGAQVVRRAAKKGGDTAQEFLTDATERMQHQPRANYGHDICSWLHGRNLNRLDDET